MEWGGWRGSGWQCFDSDPSCIFLFLGDLLAWGDALVTEEPRRGALVTG